ncbi:MAG: hypothetical protein IKI40_06085, partial [Treponema sp.]|nr:hypothetical protein [Treponema sp.]
MYTDISDKFLLEAFTTNNKNRSASMKRKHLKNIGLVLLVLSLLLTACGSESTGYMQGADRALPLSDQTTASEQEEKQEISSENTSLTEKDSIETTDLPDVDADSNT